MDNEIDEFVFSSVTKYKDFTFKSNPPFASILHGVSVPKIGGDTIWASMSAAYDNLPEGLKLDLEGLEAIHDMGTFRNDFYESYLYPCDLDLDGYRIFTTVICIKFNLINFYFKYIKCNTLSIFIKIIFTLLNNPL